jgi:hypothetical protein
VEEIERQAKHGASEVGVVAEEGVGSVDLVPIEPGSYFVETLEDFHTAFGGDVRILATPDHEEFALDLAGASHGVVLHAFAETAFVNVGGIEADGAVDAGIHGGAEGEVASHADAHDAETASAVGAFGEMSQHGAGIVIIGGDGLGGLEDVAAV